MLFLDQIKESSREFQRLLEGSELRALNYLLFTNAGGAIATAGFTVTVPPSHLQTPVNCLLPSYPSHAI